MQYNDIVTYKNIEDMAGYCGYISPEGVFYKEKKIYELGEIESDLFAWSLLKIIKNKETGRGKKKMELLRETLGRPDKVLQNIYGFVKISDDDGIVSFSYNFEKMTDIQKDIVIALQTRYFGKSNALKLKR